MATLSPASLLAIKLFVPPVRPDRVQRPRLLARLDEILRNGARLLLISAPAGFGKTSLLAEWISTRQQAVAWISLDSGDNDPGLFLSYLVAALQRAQPGAAPESLALTSAQPPAQPSAILPVLVNELSGINPAAPVLLALDDFQFITSSGVREALNYLVEHLPPGLRIAIATRSDPPLPLPRLRARGQMVELRAADLRFTHNETAEFLARTAGLSLPIEEAQALSTTLADRTEGWAAGLQMAILALQGLARRDAGGSGRYSVSQVEIAEFVRTFSGSHRFVLDYLVEEVLERLPQTTVNFLLQTSLLDRFCAELCATVIQPDGSSEGDSRAYRELLAQLEQSNLFIIPLDDERRWFRYHHLFTDLLRARFKQVFTGRSAIIHSRASAWFERENWIVNSIQHALAAQDWERAARLVEQNTIALLARGELHNLLRWIHLLPDDLAVRRPWLCVCRAWTYIFSGDLDRVEEALRLAEANLHQVQSDAERRELNGHIAAIRSHKAVILGDPPGVLQNAAMAHELLPANTWAYSVADWSVGYLYRGMGDLEKARELFKRVFDGDRSRGNPWGAAMNATDLGLVLRAQGRLQESLAVYRSALDFIEEHQARRNGYVGRLLAAMAASLYEQNDLDGALQLLEESRALNQHWFNPNHSVFTFVNLARVLTARLDWAGAASALDEAEATLRALPVVPTLGQSVAGSRIRLLLAQGRSPALEGPLESLVRETIEEVEQTSLPFLEPREQRHLLAARLLVAVGRPQDALKVLENAEATARRLGRTGLLVEILGLKSLAHWISGDSQSARSACRTAAAVAQPEGYLRSFLDLDSLRHGVLRDLLEDLAASCPQYQEFCETLLTALAPADRPGVAKTPALPESPLAATQPARAKLVEPLTDREIEVLRLMADGLTNAQIGMRLFITTGTVKAHTAGIFRKLDAANRTQAVALARELGIL